MAVCGIEAQKGRESILEYGKGCEREEHEEEEEVW
jgi:hypothetical protein